MSIKFGTDGWRAIIADEFTFANVARVAQAAAEFWSANSVAGTEKKVIVGYDRRFASDAFARCCAEVFVGNGFQVVLTPCPTPTPSVSYAVKDQHAVGGVMITASHNPPAFNGFKLKSHYGGSADAATCAAIETFLNKGPVRTTPLADAVKARQLKIKDLRPAHYAAVKQLVDFKRVAKSGLRFAHEALFGVGAGCFETLLAGTTCRVTTLNGQHDAFFGGINPEPIKQNYTRSAAFLKKHPHDICLVTDGDADRVGGMDGRGGYLTTHQIICLLLHHLVVNRQGRGRVVKALTTTSMVDAMCAAYGLDLIETGVGFKYIVTEMIKGGVLLGVEESGGIGFPGHIPERDGLAAGLMLLELLAVERLSVNKLLAKLVKQFGPHEYGRIDTHFPLEKRAALVEHLGKNPPARLLRSPLAEVKTFDGVKFIAQDSSWLMLRASGTEPILRIYAEGKSQGDVRMLLNTGVRFTRQI
ncbi:MAG TPA: phosphoglucomutase/phosphomannomutase family protein [Candidatus Paceibacterota bacterium]|nr:phosphoglucomutase/phosphomannomutase family protein [Verrucomicrobiota bacterium]HSA11915.1 phosphoglucomutase/phosphomannomutase family protein [Candidatus Paceibacterota bacterium]